MKKYVFAAIAAVLTMVGGYAISHGGALDVYGCHTDHKTGSYHCHK